LRLRPFFSFFGSKYRTGARYPSPQHETIVEPFAGGAGYATRYSDRNVILVERDPLIAALWKWLVAVPPVDILRLPLIRHDQTTDDLPVSQEAKWLIGFWVTRCASSPRKRPCAWMRDGTKPTSFWCETTRDRIAWQVAMIRHWKVIEGDYSAAPDHDATWFIDPPYEDQGKHYRFGSKGFDYGRLAAWAQTRRGQVMVCENEGAAWMPFAPFHLAKGNARNPTGVSREAIWTNAGENKLVAGA